MTPALEELKVRARIARNAAVRSGVDPAPRLADCLHEAARKAGFRQWEHARRVLGGLARPGEDMGTFWHAPGCNTLINRWFADLGQARLAQGQGDFLLPYGRQFLLVQDDFIRELDLDPAAPAWSAAGHDLVAAYGNPAWAQLCVARLRGSAWVVPATQRSKV